MQTSLTAHSLTVAVVLLVVGPVRAAADARHPGGIGAIPVNGATETGFEIHERAPGGFPHQLLAGERIPAVVTRTVSDVLNQAFGFACNGQNFVHHVRSEEHTSELQSLRH